MGVILSDKSRKTVLLLGNYRPTLPLARMLRVRGYEVIAGTQGPESDFKHCRFISSFWNHSYGSREPDRFFEELFLYCERHPELEAIFPVLEDYVRLFVEHENLLPKLPPIIMVNPALALKCMDKLYTMQLAEECSVPIAPFKEARDDAQLKSAVEPLGFPMVIRSAIAINRLHGKKAITVSSVADLEHLQVDWQQHPTGLILQRRASGIRHNIYFAAFEGRICRYLHAVITRTDMLDGSGQALEGLTVEPDADIKLQSEKMVRALNYSGVGCLQYLVDSETGESSFLEINPRIAGNHVVPEYAGLELGCFMMDLVLGNKLDLTLRTGRSGIRYAWASRDFIVAKTAWRNKEIDSVTALSWFVKALISGLRANVHILFSWDDPKPGLVAWAMVIPGINRLLFFRGD